MSWCRCASCDHEFTGPTPFDRHQNWDYKRRPALICHDPAELGMKQNQHDRWGSAERRPVQILRGEQPVVKG